MPRTCPKCKAESEDGALFCGECGYPLTTTTKLFAALHRVYLGVRYWGWRALKWFVIAYVVMAVTCLILYMCGYRCDKD